MQGRGQEGSRLGLHKAEAFRGAQGHGGVTVLSTTPSSPNALQIVKACLLESVESVEAQGSRERQGVSSLGEETNQRVP